MVDVNGARDELEQILNGKDYLAYENEKIGFLSAWWDKVKTWLAELLEKLFPSLETTTLFAGPLLIIIIAVLLVLVGTAIFFIVRNKRRTRKFYEKSPIQSLREIEWSRTQHIEKSIEYELAGNYSLATRHLFFALLVYFNEKGWLEARIWKTNWEYYEELKKVEQVLAEQFYEFANFFDESAYGEREIEHVEYTRFREMIMELLGVSDE